MLRERARSAMPSLCAVAHGHTTLVWRTPSSGRRGSGRSSAAPGPAAWGYCAWRSAEWRAACPPFSVRAMSAHRVRRAAAAACSLVVRRQVRRAPSQCGRQDPPDPREPRRLHRPYSDLVDVGGRAVQLGPQSLDVAANVRRYYLQLLRSSMTCSAPASSSRASPSRNSSSRPAIKYSTSRRVVIGLSRIRKTVPFAFGLCARMRCSSVSHASSARRISSR